MALVVFRSRAAAEIYMFAETAQRIFDILGRPAAPHGVFTPEQLPEALERLMRAVEQDRAPTQAAQAAQDAAALAGDLVPAAAQVVGLAQRAYPLLEMMRAAVKRHVDVTWGV